MNINYKTIESILAKIDAETIDEYEPCNETEYRIVTALDDYNHFVDIVKNYPDHIQRCCYVSLFDDKLDFSFANDESIETPLNDRIDEIVLNRPLFVQLCLMTYDEITTAYPKWHII